jgi:hypothetical protein
MATLTTLLVRATVDPHVVLDAATQRTIWALGARDVALRAALAACPQLDDSLRTDVAACPEVTVRRAFMARTDLRSDEIEATVAVETRSTVLVQAATETTSADLLRVLATKGGQRLQQAVALNPAADDATRLAAGRKLLDRERLGKLSSSVQLLLAESIESRRYALTESHSAETLALALPLLPVTDGVDTDAVLARALRLLQSVANDPERAGRLAGQLARLRWLTGPAFGDELQAQLEKIRDSSRWTLWTVNEAFKDLGRSEADLRADFDRLWSPVLLVREATDRVQLESTQLSIAPWYAGAASGAYGLLLALALLENPVTPLRLLRDAVRQSPELRARAQVPALRSVRLDAALMAASFELDEKLLADVDVAAVAQAAAAESFWDHMLVRHLVESGRLGPAELVEIPLAALPPVLPSSALQSLVSYLGHRTADTAWLEAALTLSAGFDGRLDDLVSMVDCV